MAEYGGHRVGGIAGIPGLEFYHAEGISTDFARSLHLGWEIGMSSDGEAVLVWEHGRARIHAGTMFVIPPNTAHSIEVVTAHSFCALRLSRELVDSLLDAPTDPPRVPTVEHPDEARQTWCWLCGQLLHELPEPAHRSALLGGIRTILGRLTAQAEPLPAPVARMQAILAERVAERVSLAELGELVELSQFHAARLFKSHIGVSPHEYHLLLRVEKAKELLNEDHSVTEVAARVGFADQSHLHRYFKRYVHTTPGEYRRWLGSESKKIQAEIGDRMESFLEGSGAFGTPVSDPAVHSDTTERTT